MRNDARVEIEEGSLGCMTRRAGCRREETASGHSARDDGAGEANEIATIPPLRNGKKRRCSGRDDSLGDAEEGAALRSG